MRQSHPWRRKQTGAWYATVQGRQIRLAGPGDPKEAAWDALRAILGAGGTISRPSGAVSVAGLCVAFLAHQEERCRGGEITKATLDHYRVLVTTAAAGPLANVPAAELTPKAVLGWAMARKVWGAARRRAAVQAVRAVTRWATQTGQLPRDPLAGLKPPPAVARDFDATQDIRAKLREVATDQAWADFILALELTGCRPGEVAAVTAADVDLEAGTWLVKNKTARATGESHRIVFLPPALVELVRRLMLEHPSGPLFRNSQGGRWHRWSWGARMRRARRHLGLSSKLITYSLRHAFGTDAVAAEVNPVVVANLMGHRSTDMLLKTYAKIAQRREAMHDALARFRGEEKPKGQPDE
jgi:integrase